MDMSFGSYWACKNTCLRLHVLYTYLGIFGPKRGPSSYLIRSHLFHVHPLL